MSNQAPLTAETIDVEAIRARCSQNVTEIVDNPREYYRLQQILRDRESLLAEVDRLRMAHECLCGCRSGGCGRPDGCRCDKTCPCGAAANASHLFDRAVRFGRDYVDPVLGTRLTIEQQSAIVLFALEEKNGHAVPEARHE